MIREAVALDTNVLSEIMRIGPDPRIVRFVSELDDPRVSAAVFHELSYGVGRLPQGRRKLRMAREIEAFFVRYEKRIVAVDFAMAKLSGKLRAKSQAMGRVLEPMDALIGASALHVGAKLATRNIKYFIDLGIELVNPWT